jgi:hypothetical protein
MIKPAADYADLKGEPLRGRWSALARNSYADGCPPSLTKIKSGTKTITYNILKNFWNNSL